MIGALKISKGSRSSLMKKNVFFTFLIKGLGITTNLAFIPLTLNYVNSERYGIWLTISSIISWFGLLDIGFGNGLRNKFAEAIAKNDINLQRKLIHTTLIALTFISITIFLVYYLFAYNLEWDKLIGVSSKYRLELQELVFVLVSLFCLQFILQIFNPISYALQKPVLVSLNILLGNIFGLIGVLVLREYYSPTLINLGIVIMGGNIFSFLLCCIYFFIIERKDLLTSFKWPNLNDVTELLSLGIKFFVINIAYVVQFQTSNLLISRYFSPEKVTDFNIAFKMFSITSIVFNIVISPVWSSVTNAKVNDDYTWISRLIKKLLLIWLCLCIGGITLLIFSNNLYSLWVGNNIQIPLQTSLGVFLVVCSSSFSSIFIHTLNGLSKVKLQFYLALITIFSFVPLVYFMSIKLSLGIFGVCLAIVISNINGLIIAPVQVYRLIKANKL